LGCFFFRSNGNHPENTLTVENKPYTIINIKFAIIALLSDITLGIDSTAVIVTKR
jgi:hypothetical protein